MHYSPLNAVAAASPASASPSSSHSALSPVASNSLNHLSYHQSSHLSANEHVHHHHSLSHDDLMAHAHMSDSMSSVNSPVAPFSNGNSSNNNNSVSNTPTKQEMCDDLATYTTLTSVNNTQLNHYPEQGSQAHQMAQQTNNGPKGANKRTTTATKSSYNGKSNSSATANGNAPNGSATPTGRQTPGGGKKTKGRVKIKMEFIDNKLRRYTTFSKRKTGIMKKAYELSTLTGTQVMLLVASETGHVYTFATRKLQPMITSDAGKALIQTCLNSPDLSGGLMNGTGGNQQSTNSSSAGPEVVTTNGHVSSLLGGSNNTSSGLSNHTIVNTVPDHSDMSRMVLTNGSAGPGSISGCSRPNTVVDQRMSATGFEETELSYSVNGEECSPLNDKHLYHASPAPSSASSLSSASSSCAASSPPILLSMSAAASNGDVGAGPNGTSNGSMSVYDHPMGGSDHHSFHQHHHNHQYSSPSPMLQPPLPPSSVSHHHPQFTTLNSAASMGQSGLLNPALHQQSQQMSSANNVSSVSSFFNSFGSGTGNSPPPLTPNGLLSGLHSFLFADSSTLGLDSFVDCVGNVGANGDMLMSSGGVNSYLVPGPQSNGGQSSASSSPVTLAGLNAVAPSSGPNSNSNNIRLPPFCTI